MRFAVVVAAMFFCAPVFAQGEKLPSVTNSIGMELIEIPAGKFMMGCSENDRYCGNDEAPVPVTLTKPFRLGKTEVTQGQWQSVMGTEPWKGLFNVVAHEDSPAIHVSWDDATAFCEKLTAIERKAGTLKANEKYRLPTDAEREYACRAGTTTTYSFGDDDSKLGEYAWFIDNCRDGKPREEYAHNVGTKKPNPWGLHDMHGNVAEWCSDRCDAQDSNGEQQKPLGGTDPVFRTTGSLRFSRGGSYDGGPVVARSSGRSKLNPVFTRDSLGFRVARSQSAQ